MNYRKFVYIFLGLFMISCPKPEPTASFTASKTSALVDEVITFTNQSSNASTYAWDFGDGTSSSSDSPTHAFTSEGSFNVELTATGEGGTNTASQTITVAYPDPVAGFTMDKNPANVEVGEIITFTNSSENATSYSWSFGDGATSTDPNPTHAYTDDGTFTVQLTATGPGGATNSASETVTVTYPDPVADFTMDKSVAAPGETITFTNESEYAESYAWDFGDGATSTVTDPTHSYAAVGIYTVQLTATGFNGGTHSYSTAVTIAYPPVADFTIDKPTADVDETITFTNQSTNATSYSWDFEDGTTSTAENPTHVYSTDGTFSVQLIASGDGGKDTISKDVLIHPVSTVNIFPGVGAMGIELEETWETIKDKLSNEEYLGYFLIPGDGGNYVVHVWESLSEGVLLFNISVSASYSYSDSDILILMGLYDNFLGQTAESIQMGSTLSEVEAAYGLPDIYDTEYDSYLYDRLGIRFYYNASDIIDEMDIYFADSKKSTGIKYPEIDDLRNLKLKLQK